MIFRAPGPTIGNGRPRQYSQGPRDVVLECWQTVWSVRVLSTLTGEGFKIIRSFGRDRRHRAQNLCENSSSARFGPCLAPRRRGNRQRHRIDLIIVFAMRKPFELSKQLIEEACTGTQQDSALAKQVEVSAKPRKFVTMRLPVSREMCAAQFRLQSFGRHSPLGRSEGRIPLVFFACAIVDW